MKYTLDLDIKNEKFIYLCDIFSSRLAKLHIENIYKPNIDEEYKLYKKISSIFSILSIKFL